MLNCYAKIKKTFRKNKDTKHHKEKQYFKEQKDDIAFQLQKVWINFKPSSKFFSLRYVTKTPDNQPYIAYLGFLIFISFI